MLRMVNVENGTVKAYPQPIPGLRASREYRLQHRL